MLRFSKPVADQLEARINILPPLNGHLAIETEAGEQLTGVKAVTLESFTPEVITVMTRGSHREIAHHLLEMTDSVPLLAEGGIRNRTYEVSNAYPTLASAEVPVEGAQTPDMRRIVTVKSIALIAGLPRPVDVPEPVATVAF